MVQDERYVLPRLLAAFRDEHPRVQFSLHSSNTARSCTFFSTTNYPSASSKDQQRDRGIGTEPFRQDELVLIMLPAFASDHMSRGQLLD